MVVGLRARWSAVVEGLRGCTESRGRIFRGRGGVDQVYRSSHQEYVHLVFRSII